MKVASKILTLAVIAGTSIMVSTSASAWWNSDRDDYWGGGPWGYPGYGWQQAPRIIITQPQDSGSSQQYRIE
jgi:hypothetical protein